MFTCKKVYADIPFAHRQSNHKGHCSFIHGHNWTIAITFGCKEMDENGFVIDFGELHFLRDWIDEHLDHACVFNTSDPLREAITQACPEAYKIYTVESCSSEGLALHLYEVFNPMVKAATTDRVFITEVEVIEDIKNSATYTPEL